MKLREFFHKNNKEIVFVIVIVLCLILIFSTIALLNGYSDSLEEQARTKVALYASDMSRVFGEHMTSFDYAYKIEAVRDWLFLQ